MLFESSLYSADSVVGTLSESGTSISTSASDRFRLSKTQLEKPQKRKRILLQPVTDIDAIRALVSTLRLCHFASDRSTQHCDCLHKQVTPVSNTFDSTVSLFQSSREFISLLNSNGSSSRREFIRSFLQGSMISRSRDGKRTIYRYAIGSSSQNQAPVEVCRYVFMKAYNLNTYLLKQIQKEISSTTFHVVGVLGDRTATSLETYERLDKILSKFINGKSNELKVDGFYFAQSLLENTVIHKLASAWMEIHFATQRLQTWLLAQQSADK